MTAVPYIATHETDRPATPNARLFLALALSQVGDSYVFGAQTSPDDPDPGSFDCSELVLWCAQRAGLGRDLVPDGSWKQFQACERHDTTIQTIDAFSTPGALLFRFDGDPRSESRPAGAHVAISLGHGRVVEARSIKHGVCTSPASGRGWTHAGLVPGLDYRATARDEIVALLALPMLALGDEGKFVRVMQGALSYDSVRVDGKFGPLTRAAVQKVQRSFGQPADGVVGQETWRALLGGDRP